MMVNIWTTYILVLFFLQANRDPFFMRGSCSVGLLVLILLCYS